jgi:hypothetical protein
LDGMMMPATNATFFTPTLSCQWAEESTPLFMASDIGFFTKQREKKKKKKK